MSYAARYGLIGAGAGGVLGLGVNALIRTLLPEEIEQEIKNKAKAKGIKLKSKEFEKFRKEFIRNSYIASAAGGALSGGVKAYNIGLSRDYFGANGFRQGYRTYGRTPQMGVGKSKRILGLSGYETTKKEVKDKFKELAKKFHPDRGGSLEKMKEINKAMDELKDSDWFQKLAFWKGFYG